MQVAPLSRVEALEKLVMQTVAELAEMKSLLPEWVREDEAQTITGLSQATLARARKKPGSLIVWKSAGGLRYLRSSLLAYNEARSIRRAA